MVNQLDILPKEQFENLLQSRDEFITFSLELFAVSLGSN